MNTVDTALDELMAIAEYWGTNRQVGHTTAMLEGALNVDNALVLAHNQMFADDLKRQSKGNGTQFVSPFKFDERLKGMRRPLVVDHHHMMNLISALPALVSSLTNEAELRLIDTLIDEQEDSQDWERAHPGYSATMVTLETLSKHKAALLKLSSASSRPAESSVRTDTHNGKENPQHETTEFDN